MEKFQTDGVSQLSESELLAIIIGNGPKEFPTVDLMNQMLDDCGNDLSKLGKKTMEELMCYRGIGKNWAIAIVAACEFGKRFRKTAPEEKPVLKNALAIGDYMMPQLEDLAAKLTQAAESVRMTLRDHIILADEQYFSFKDNKKL